MKRKVMALMLGVLILLCLCTPTQAIEIVSMRSQLQPEEISITLEDEENYINVLKKHISEIEILGIDPYLLKNVKIEVYPRSSFITEENLAQIVGCTGQVSLDETCILGDMTIQQNVIMLCTQCWIIGAFNHEIGHVIHNKKFNVNGYDWFNSNELAQQYIELVNYNKKLDYKSQIDLPYEERIAEWFAEDVRYFLTKKTGQLPLWKNTCTQQTSEEVKEFLEDLIFGGETIKNTIIWNKHGYIIGIIEDGLDRAVTDRSESAANAVASSTFVKTEYNDYVQWEPDDED